jgi:FkbM family methyltransferase
MVISFDKIVEKYNLKIKGVLHIGAHFGQEYEGYVNQGIKNMIFFEPVKSIYSKLLEHLGKALPGENITTYNVALGSELCQKEMFIEKANLGQSSSLLEPKDHLVYSPTIRFDSREVVSVVTLDSIEFDRTLFNMINIDVQGYELEVFKGAVETLKTIDIIYSEINLEELYKDCVQVGELDSFLKKFGFVRILTQLAHKSWGDALYLKY